MLADWAAFIIRSVAVLGGWSSADISAFVGHYGLPKRRELHAERLSVASQKAWTTSVTVQHVYIARVLPHAAVLNLYCLCLRPSWLHVSALRISLGKQNWRLLQCVSVQHSVSCYCSVWAYSTLYPVTSGWRKALVNGYARQTCHFTPLQVFWYQENYNISLNRWSYSFSPFKAQWSLYVPPV